MKKKNEKKKKNLHQIEKEWKKRRTLTKIILFRVITIWTIWYTRTRF